MISSLLAPPTSAIFQLPTFEPFLESPASLPFLTPWWFAVFLSDLHRPESCSSMSQSCLQSARAINNPSPESGCRNVEFSPWFLEQTCQVPWAYPHKIRKTTYNTCRSSAKEICSSTFQRKLSVYKFSKSVWYSSGIYTEEQVRSAQFSYQPFSFFKGSHVFNKDLAYFNCILAPKYVQLETLNVVAYKLTSESSAS